jgi:hypothetical protein
MNLAVLLAGGVAEKYFVVISDRQGPFQGVGPRHTGFGEPTRIGTLISRKTGDESRCLFGKCEGRANQPQPNAYA